MFKTAAYILQNVLDELLEKIIAEQNKPEYQNTENFLQKVRKDIYRNLIKS